jgi:hypothetical protein
MAEKINVLRITESFDSLLMENLHALGSLLRAANGVVQDATPVPVPVVSSTSNDLVLGERTKFMIDALPFLQLLSACESLCCKNPGCAECVRTKAVIREKMEVFDVRKNHF